MEAKTCALSKILEADKEEARKQKEISGLRRGFFPPMKKTQSSSKSQPKSKAESQKNRKHKVKSEIILMHQYGPYIVIISKNSMQFSHFHLSYQTFL